MGVVGLAYRPALDGLRGVAVAAVIAYHLGAPFAPGGFLGVDVFLVVSGYLITALLLAEHDRSGGRIDLKDFWIRRARRLLPALIVVLVAVAVWGHLAAPPATLDRLRGDGLAALGYVANWRFVATGQSYFEAFLEPSPLRHLWSLGVEEQWYLLWPIVVVLLARLVARRRGLAVVVCGAGAVASAVLMAALHDAGSDPSRAYYGTDTRAQALLVGAALAAWRWWRPRTWGPRSRPADVAATVGLVGLGVALVVADDEASWLYSGGFLAVAAASVAAVAVAADGRGPVARALSAPPLVWVGRRSYGLYLWHWPVVVACTADSTGLGEPALAAIRLGLIVALAELSYRFVEQPVRQGRWPVRPTLGAGSVAVAASLVLLVTLATPPGTLPAMGTVLRPSIGSTAATDLGAPAPSAGATLPDGGALAPAVSALPAPAALPSPTAPPTALPPPPGDRAAPSPVVDLAAVDPAPLQVLVMGDSQAFTLATEFQPGMAGAAIDVQGQAVLGCGVAPGDQECERWRDDWRSALEVVQPDAVVVLFGAWEMLDHRIDGRWVRFGTERWGSVVRSSIAEAVDIAASSGAPVALLDAPCYRQQPYVWGGYDTEQRNQIERVVALNAIYTEVALARTGVHVLDYGGLVCPEGVYQDVVDGVEARPDGVHLGGDGAALAWAWLGPQLRALSAP